MNQDVMSELKKRLEEEKASLEKELASFARKDEQVEGNWDTKYPNREDADKEEEADEAAEYDTMLSLEHSLESKLKDVNLALEKMAGSKYGVCEKCGSGIEEARLKAAPAARLCMACNNQ